MQTFETIVNIPLYEIADRLTEDVYESNTKIQNIQVELVHEVNQPDPDTGVYSEYLTYHSFRPLKEDYSQEILDAIEAFLHSDDSRQYHELAYERYCDYIDYLTYYFN